MKEPKCYVEIRDAVCFLKSTIILFLTKNLQDSTNSTQECFTQGAQITVQVDQSYYLFAQLSPASPCTCLASTDSM